MPSTPGEPVGDRRPRGRHCRRHSLRGVADKSREESGGAEATMSAADGGNSGYGRLVVEENAAATVDLDVDEARRQGAGQLPDLNIRGQFRGRHNLVDERPGDDNRVAVSEPFAVEDAGADQGERGRSGRGSGRHGP